MGVVNASPDSFSDGGIYRTLEDRVNLASQLLDDGAHIIDIGGESGITNVDPVDVDVELERVVPVVEAVQSEIKQRGSSAVISVDTYKPQVAEAAIVAGATIVNDVSGLRNPELASICARASAGLVIMHTRARPKQRLQSSELYEDVNLDIQRFLSEKIELALKQGMSENQIILDPGPDFSKTPAQTVEVLRGLDQLKTFGMPLLLAISRKDFIGAITDRPPRERLAGTLAALGFALDHGAEIFRLHDIAKARDFLKVLEVLNGDCEVSQQVRLSEELRWQNQ